MIRNISIASKKGFTLIEIVIVLGIFAVAAGTILPREIKRVQIKAGEKTALEMSVIQEAARAYYVANKAWPGSIAVLQSGGYLNAAWVTNNPWGNSYNSSSTASTYTVSTSVTSEWVNLVARDLPSATISGNTVSSTIPIPGSATNPALPSGAVFFMLTGSCPSGTTDVTPTYSDRFLRINATAGSTGGADIHTHTFITSQVASFTGDPRINGGKYSGSWGFGGGDSWFTPEAAHSHTGTTNNGNNVPSYVTCKMCQVN